MPYEPGEMMRSELQEVRICWVDSFAKTGWAKKEEYLEEMRGRFVCVFRGAVLDEDDERVTLVLTESEGAANQALTIPKCCIVSREELVVKKSRSVKCGKGK